MGTALVIPSHLKFADLALARQPADESISFSREPLAALCACNGVDFSFVARNEEVAGWIIAEWYCMHCSRGGEPDCIAESLLLETSEFGGSPHAMA